MQQAQPNPMASAGIQSLMGGMPQGKPPSPSAAVGTVQDRVDAYAANPAGLEQRLQISPSLLDALALEELRAQQSAAKNDMMLKAQQQGKPLTVVEQREQEALEAIKAKISPPQQAQQAAGTAQQEAQEKQAALQRLTQGIAGAQGAQNVMPPRMAQGGVVGYAGGGVTEEERREAARLGVTLNPKDSPEVRATKLQLAARARKPAVAKRPPLPRGPEPGIPSLPAVGGGIRGPVPAEAPEAFPSVGASVEQGSALPGMMQAAPEAPGASKPMGLPDLLKQTGIDPAEERKARAAEAQQVFGPSLEQQNFDVERLARMRKEMEPKETAWYERLAQLAQNMPRNASGSNVGTLGDIARTGGAMQQAAQAKRAEQQAALDALQEKIYGAQRAGREKAFEAGLTAEKNAYTAQQGLGTIGASMRNTDVGAASQAESDLSRERVAGMGIAATASENQKTREQEAMLAKLSRETQVKVAQIQSAAREGDPKAKLQEIQLRRVMSDPYLKSLGDRAAAEPAMESKYLETLQRMLVDAVPELAKKTPPPAAGGPGKGGNDPLGIR